MYQKMCDRILNVFRPLHIHTRVILLDFLRWDENVGRYKANRGLLPKIIIGSFVFLLWVWAYFQDWSLPSSSNNVDLNHFILIFELLAISYAPPFLWVIRYLMQNRYVKLYKELAEFDDALEAHGVQLGRRFLNKTPAIIVKTTLIFNCLHVLIFFYACSDENVRKSLCAKIIILIIMYNAIVQVIFIVLYLRDRIIVINGILVNILDPDRVVNCNKCIIPGEVPFEDMCVVHVIRCVCILYDKYVEIFNCNTKISRSQIVTINSILFVECIFQGFVYVQIILLDKVYDWKTSYINITVMITNGTVSFFVTYLIEEIKEERNRMMRLTNRIYLRSKSKAAIKEDVQAAVLHILHKPLALSVYGLYEVDTLMFITIVNGIVIFSCMVINLNNIKNEEKIV